jgi:hypothetical protein
VEHILCSEYAELDSTIDADHEAYTETDDPTNQHTKIHPLGRVFVKQTRDRPGHEKAKGTNPTSQKSAKDHAQSDSHEPNNQTEKEKLSHYAFILPFIFVVCHSGILPNLARARKFFATDIAPLCQGSCHILFGGTVKPSHQTKLNSLRSVQRAKSSHIGFN